MADKTTVEGADRLSQTLTHAASEFEDMRAADEAGRLVATGGATRAPHDTGRLSTSIRSEKQDGVIYVGSPLDYAAVTEYGGGNSIPAQPYLRPAMEYANAPIEALYQRDTVRIMNGVKGA